MLTGQIGTDAVTLAILDHPKNFGFPTHWHARGYGLFAANPIGQKALSEGKAPPLDITLEPGASVTFRYRLLILDGKASADRLRLEREYAAFTAGKDPR
jgi:methane monooxygenase PmoA-like